jgi:hypothetical protein
MTTDQLMERAREELMAFVAIRMEKSAEAIRPQGVVSVETEAHLISEYAFWVNASVVVTQLWSRAEMEGRREAERRERSAAKGPSEGTPGVKA